MATITGLSKERMLEIEAASIVGGAVVAGHLILTKHNASTIDAGYVIGPGANILVVTRATRPTGGALFTGLMIYETDTKQIWVYDGAWVYRGGVVICTSTTRPTGTALFVGLRIYETDTGNDLVYVGAVCGWCKPWNSSWGIIDDQKITTPQSGIGAGTTDLTGFTTTFTPKPNRKLKFTINLGYCQPTAASQWRVNLVKDGSLFGTFGYIDAPSAGNTGMSGFVTDTGPTAVSHIYKASVIRSAAAASFTLGGAAELASGWTVEDIGPAGNPS